MLAAIRQRAVFIELLADLGADELDPLLGDRGVVGLELGHDPLGELCAREPFLERKADQRAVGAAEALHGEFAQIHLVDHGADAREIGGVAVSDLDHRSAPEIDAEIEAACGEEYHGKQG